MWQGLPRVFDILVLFGIKVVNFLCSGREGFQLCTLLGKFFRVVAVQRNVLEVPGVSVAAHGARGSPGTLSICHNKWIIRRMDPVSEQILRSKQLRAGDALGFEYFVFRILLLFFIDFRFYD